MHLYHFEFMANGETEPARVETLRATSPGHAQKKFHEKFPGCKILQQWREAQLVGQHYGQITYEPVSTAKVESLPVAKFEEQVFPFLDDCLSKRPAFSEPRDA
jgi:hypothetical protein